jgi:hypothetical protein
MKAARNVEEDEDGVWIQIWSQYNTDMTSMTVHLPSLYSSHNLVHYLSPPTATNDGTWNAGGQHFYLGL